MIALIKKDMVTLKKSLILMGIISIAMIIYGIYEGQIIMIPLLCAMIPLILTGICFGYDSRSNFEQMAFSMPIKKRDYVLSKLFLALVFGIVGAVAMMILTWTHGQIPIKNIAFISVLTLVIILLFSAVQLPFILKYGAEKGRLILVVTYFLIFSVSSLFKGKLNHMLSLIENYSVSALGISAILIGIAIILLSLKFSIGIMERKEY